MPVRGAETALSVKHGFNGSQKIFWIDAVRERINRRFQGVFLSYINRIPKKRILFPVSGVF
jgi:hypothetical protein